MPPGGRNSRLVSLLDIVSSMQTELSGKSKHSSAAGCALSQPPLPHSVISESFRRQGGRQRGAEYKINIPHVWRTRKIFPLP